MTIESIDDVESLKRIGKVVSFVLQEMLSEVKPGMTTRELDAIGEKLLEGCGARSAPKLTYNFPGTTCISINEEAAHGVPGDRVIQAGDVVNVDVSAELNDYYADTGGTCVVPPSTLIKTRLCQATQLALTAAMKQARAGIRINRIGAAIQETARAYLFQIVANLGSHGVGRALHEDPDQILSYYNPADRRVLHEGMVITIEPFLSTKTRYVKTASDGWTLVGPRGNLFAQFEHTLIVTRGEPIVVTQY